MDFFSAGGFQQLFNELNDDNDAFACSDLNELERFSTGQNTELQKFDAPINSCRTEPFFGDNFDDSCDIFNITEDMMEADVTKQFFDLESITHDQCKNVEFSAQAETLALLECTEALITQEIAEWEDKFLDNYIEIPELVEFLPEKTPLCTETCELFLRESSKNLQLNRKSKTMVTSDNESCEKGYVCTFGNCRKIYAKPAHLKAHLRRHLGEKPYVCTWPDCTWKFSRSDELARHRRSHSGVKPYKCEYCAKCFARSDHLTKHRKVHERRLLAASKAGVLPQSVFSVRPGRRRKNTIF